MKWQNNKKYFNGLLWLLAAIVFFFSSTKKEKQFAAALKFVGINYSLICSFRLPEGLVCILTVVGGFSLF